MGLIGRKGRGGWDFRCGFGCHVSNSIFDLHPFLCTSRSPVITHQTRKKASYQRSYALNLFPLVLSPSRLKLTHSAYNYYYHCLIPNKTHRSSRLEILWIAPQINNTFFFPLPLLSALSLFRILAPKQWSSTTPTARFARPAEPPSPSRTATPTTRYSCRRSISRWSTTAFLGLAFLILPTSASWNPFVSVALCEFHFPYYMSHERIMLLDLGFWILKVLLGYTYMRVCFDVDVCALNRIQKRPRNSWRPTE